MMSTNHRKRPTPADPAAIPEFDRAMRAIVRAPKSAVEQSIQRERDRKAKRPKSRHK
jgi:hypothetical protein